MLDTDHNISLQAYLCVAFCLVIVIIMGIFLAVVNAQ